MPSLRIPFVWPDDNRLISTGRDARRKNVIEEDVDGQRILVSKRPGFTTSVSFGGGNGQGLTNYNGIIYGVVGDTLRAASAPPSSGASGANWTAATAPNWSGRSILCAVVFKDQVFVFGGTSASDQGDVWVTSDGNIWRQATGAAPFGSRQGMAACVFNDRIYVSGGLGNTTFGDQNDVWSSDDGANWVLEVENCPWSPRDQHAMVSTSNGLFVLGGWNVAGTRNNEVWFSADGKNWAQVTGAAAWSARQSFGCVVFNNKLYVVGGSDAVGNKNDVYSSPDGKVWTLETAGAFAAGRTGLACVVYAGRIWALGGNTGAAVNDVYYTTTGSGAWVAVALGAGFTARYQHAAVVYRTPTSVSSYHYPSLWVLGGAPTTNTVYRANLDTAVSSSVALAPTAAGQPFQFNSFQAGTRLLIKNQSNLWVMDSGTVVKVTNAGYPLVTVPGIVVLGGFAYVLTPDALIYNCDLDNPYSWQSINVLGADYEDDLGVAIAKYLNYVAVFGTFTTQLFYDAGNDYGSPLSPYLNASSRIGCADANSIVIVGTTLAWVSQTLDKKRQVTIFNGLQPTAISNPFIEEYLNASNSFKAFACTVKGQLCYVLNVVDRNITWAYSFSRKRWFEWEYASGAPFNVSGYAVDFASGNQYILSASAGVVSVLSDTVYDDNGTPFTVSLRTSKVDFGNNLLKAFGRLDVIGDQNPGTPSISFSDDDYQTYGPARTVDMSGKRPALFRNGAARRRAYLYEQTDSNPMRLEALEQHFTPGT